MNLNLDKPKRSVLFYILVPLVFAYVSLTHLLFRIIGKEIPKVQ